MFDIHDRLVRKFSKTGASLGEVLRLAEYRREREGITRSGTPDFHAWKIRVDRLLADACDNLREVDRESLIAEASKLVEPGGMPSAELMAELGDQSLAALLSVKAGFYMAALGEGCFLIDPHKAFVN